jgi:phosphatidylethanolamine N-methyltransferase
MHKLYGDSLCKEAGFVKVMKCVASKNVKIAKIEKILKSRAVRYTSDLERDVIETFDKVYEETADAVG